MPMPVKVKKWGSSMAVLIPSHFANSKSIVVGSVVDIESVDLLRPPTQRRYRLAELLVGFKRRHRRGEWDLGKPIGREVW